MDSNSDDPNTVDFVMRRSLLAKNKLAFIMPDPDGMVRYSCVECSAKYEDIEELETHLMVHNNEYRFLCGICGTGLKRKEHLDRHTMEHQEVRPHVCPDCGKAFKRKEHLNIHRTIHTGDKNESCPVCNKAFYRRDHLRKHLQTHTKAFLEKKSGNNEQETEQEYVEIKEEPYELSDEINEEILDESIIAEEHPVAIKSERPFQCPICFKSYKRKDHLKIHSWTHKKKDHVCSECGKAFHREDQLLVHMNYHLQFAVASPSEEYIIDDQHYEQMDAEPFSADNDLLVARSSVPDRQQRFKIESRPHECDVCHRRFKRKQHLKVHMNVHMKGQPSIWCSICGEGFILNQDFENHQCSGTVNEDYSTENYGDEEQSEDMQVTAQETPQEAKKENKYPQEFVDVTMLSPDPPEEVNYSQYVEERELPMPQRVFVCKYCSKPFKRKDHYKIHLHIHTGIKSFFCPDCGKGFYRKDHLQKHVLVHMRMRPPPKKEIPGLYPIKMMPKKKEVKPEITIHAPSNTKLRVPLQIKVPYQVVMSMDNGEQRAVTIDPQASGNASS